MTKQGLASAARQIGGVLASIYGVLTAANSHLHLNPWVSGILTATGPIILAVEHFVADPSTGTGVQAVKVIDATPDVQKIVDAAKTEIARFVNDAKVFVAPPVAAPAPSVPQAPPSATIASVVP